MASMHGNQRDLRGMKFGHWRVVSREPNRDGLTRWLCECSCGKQRVKYTRSLYHCTPNSSCGCKRSEVTSAAVTKWHRSRRRDLP